MGAPGSGFGDGTQGAISSQVIIKYAGPTGLSQGVCQAGPSVVEGLLQQEAYTTRPSCGYKALSVYCPYAASS